MTRSLELAVSLACAGVVLAACGRTTSDPAQAVDVGVGGSIATGGAAGSGSAGEGGGGSASPTGGVGPGGSAGPGGSGGSGGTGGTGGSAGTPVVVPTGPCSSWLVSDPVAYGAEVEGDVAVWAGNGYVLVRGDTHTRSPWEREWYDIVFQLVDLAGNVIADQLSYETYEMDASALPVDIGRAIVLDVAPTDDGYGILWCHTDTDTWDGELKFGRVDADGVAVIEPQVLAPCDWQLSARLVWNGSAFAAVWEYAGGLRFVEFDGAGALVAEIQDLAVNGMIWTLELFWDGSEYGLFYEEAHAALDANRFLRLAAGTGPVGEAVLLTAPDAYSQGLFVTERLGGYGALWEERGIAGDWDRMLLADVEPPRDPRSGLTEIDSHPVAGLAANDFEYGVMLAHSELIDTRTARSYGFTTLSSDGTWGADELPVFPNDGYPLLVDFEWHESAFDVLYTVDVGEERRLAHTQISCLPD